MNIGLIGAGAIGTAIARALSRSGMKISIANSRGPASLAGLVAGLGPHARAVTVKEAAQADMVFLAVNSCDVDLPATGDTDVCSAISSASSTPMPGSEPCATALDAVDSFAGSSPGLCLARLQTCASAHR